MNKKYFIIFFSLIIFLLLLLELYRYKSINNKQSKNLYENYTSLYYPKVVTWSPSYVDNYYQPGYNQYFYNNAYYYPVY